jgi:aryl-alcohol dehydrogenase-like predicted oxidoreductase
VGLSRKHILAAIEGSLRRLRTSYVDLYQVHTWDPDTPLEETLTTLNDLVRGGRVRYIGVSNFTALQIAQAQEIVRRRGLEPFVALQAQYSLLCRSTEWDLAQVARDERLAVLPWSPLAGGWLSGKYRRGAQPEAGRVAWAERVGWEHTNWSALDNDHTWRVLDALDAVARETGRSHAQVALRWLMQRPGGELGGGGGSIGGGGGGC